jgi:hypothetical protein
VYGRLWRQALEVLGNSEADASLRLAAGKCVRGVIKVLPKLFADEIARVVAALRPVISSVSGPLRQCCYGILLNFARAYPDRPDAFFDTIWEYTGRDLSATSQVDQVVIWFWTKFVSFAVERRNRSVRDKVLARVAPQLLPRFFECVLDVRPEDTAPELGHDMPAWYAISLFLTAMPNEVFPMFIKPTFEAQISSTRWQARHAALSLLSLWSWPLRPADEACAFISTHIQDVLDACRTATIPRLQTTSLWVLEGILQQPPGVLINRALCSDPSQLVQEILDLVRHADGTPDAILELDCRIIGALPHALSGDDSWEYVIQEVFPDLLSALQHIAAHAPSPRVHCAALDGLSAVLQFTPPSGNSSMLALLVEALDALANAAAPVRAALCYYVTGLVRHLDKLVPAAEISRTIALLLDVINCPDAIEYALEALLAAVSIHPAAFQIEQIRRFLEIAITALHSNVVGVIQVGAMSITGIFLTRGADVANRFSECLAAADEFLRADLNSGMSPAHPMVLNAITILITCTPEAATPEVEKTLWALMTMCRRVSIHNDSPTAVAYGNDLFTSLARVYCVYAQQFYPHLNPGATDKQYAREREILFEMSMFTEAIMQVRELENSLLEEFIHMAREFARNCTRRNNTMLNRARVHKMLDLAIKKRSVLGEKARKAQLYLKSK